MNEGFLNWPQGSDSGTSLGLPRQNVASRSDIGLVRSGRPGLRIYDAKSDFAVRAHNLRLQGAGTYLSSDSLGLIGCLTDLSDVCMSSYGSVSDGFDQKFTWESERSVEHQIIIPQSLRTL